MGRPGALRQRLLQAYRLAVLLSIAWAARESQAAREASAPRAITLREVRDHLPSAAQLEIDGAGRGGVRVLDRAGVPIGSAVSTSPEADSIVGYAGPSDALVVLDDRDRVVGIALRRSADTPGHVADVVADRAFLGTFDGMSRDEVAALELESAGVEGVSGATRTSLCVAESVVYRLGATGARGAGARVGAHDLAIVALLSCALLLERLRGRRRQLARRALQLAVLVYLGLVTGDLLAVSLFSGWAQFGVPWRATPGLVVLALAALLVPWATRRQVYCAHVCPHGALQEWLGRATPRCRVALPAAVRKGLATLPALLLAAVLATVLLGLPLDLAGIEPFDAYVLSASAGAAVVLAVVGLVAAPFVGMAYCRFGCPTGALLKFVRARGRADRFSARDLFAGVLLLLALFCARFGAGFRDWLADQTPL